MNLIKRFLSEIRYRISFPLLKERHYLFQEDLLNIKKSAFYIISKNDFTIKEFEKMSIFEKQLLYKKDKILYQSLEKLSWEKDGWLDGDKHLSHCDCYIYFKKTTPSTPAPEQKPNQT